MLRGSEVGSPISILFGFPRLWRQRIEQIGSRTPRQNVIREVRMTYVQPNGRNASCVRRVVTLDCLCEN